MFPGSQWGWKQLLDNRRVFISLALVIERLSIVALLLCAHGHSLQLLTFQSRVDPPETGLPLRGFPHVILSLFLRNTSRLHVCSRLRGPPADNYRYLFFINEVKSQHSLPFFERETFSVMPWLLQQMPVSFQMDEHLHLHLLMKVA